MSNSLGKSGRIKLVGVGHDYGDVRAVEGVELDMEPGRIQALLGPSGCGKTTLLRILAGLLTPTHGQVMLDGRDVTHIPTDKRGVVLVHQEQLLFPNMSVLDNAAYPLRARGVPRRDARHQARARLAQVQLADLEARRPKELSGGQRQRVALARALCAQPRVLLLDEPLSALDAGLREAMRSLIMGVQQETQLTTVVVTHDQREAASLAHRVAVMSQGRVMQNLPVDQLYRDPGNEETAHFLGATNFFDARFEGTIAHTELGQLRLAEPAESGAGRLCIWPEDLRLGGGENAVSGRVIDAVFTGSERRVQIQVREGICIEAVLPRWSETNLGQELTVQLPPERLVALKS